MARPTAGHADGRSRLLAAAWTALVGTGGAAASISVASVCAAAGCTPPTLYHHFEDLPDLLRAAARKAFDAWADEIDAQVCTTADPADRLRQRAEAYLAWARANPRPYRAMFDRSPGASSPLDERASGRPGPAFDGVLRDVAALHRAAPGDPDLLPLALAHWAAVHGVASLAIAAPQVPDAHWNGALTVLTRALAADAEAHARPASGTVPDSVSFRR